MSKYTKNTKHTFTFEEDKVEVTLSRFKVKDMLTLAPYMKTEGTEGTEEVTGTMDDLQMMEEGSRILPDYVVSMTGLKDADGYALGIADIVGEVYFMELIGQIFTALMQGSELKEEDAGNLPVQPNTSTEEPESNADYSLAE